MKYINFKRYKFSTPFKNIKFKRYFLNKTYKYINFTKYYLLRVYDLANIKKYNIYKVVKYFSFKKYIYSSTRYFYKVIKYFNYKSYIYSLFRLKRYDYYKTSKLFKLKTYQNILFYFFGATLLAIIIYFSIPFFFNYDKLLVNNICKDYKIKCSVAGSIKYNFFPSPRIKFNNLTIKDSKNKTVVEVEKAIAKLFVLKLYNRDKLNYKKIEMHNGEVNFNFASMHKYKFLFKNNLGVRPIELINGEINLLESNQLISSIQDVNLQYKFKKNSNNLIIKGQFANEPIIINLNNFEKKIKS